jgi:N-acetylornithine carbamoyltransferase
MGQIDHFTNTAEVPLADLERILTRASAMKAGESEQSLAGRSVALVFFDPSVRTRTSMEVGIFQLGGHSVVLEPGNSSWALEHRDNVVMDGGKAEHVKEFVRVLSRYVDAIGVRTFAKLENWNEQREDPVLGAFVKWSDVPVINLESAMYHPCQAMADIMTIREKFGSEKKRIVLSWAWHPKPLPMAVPNSFALAAAQFGHELSIAAPKGYELDEDLITRVNEFAGREIKIYDNMDEAFDGADVIYAKSWGSRNFYGNAAADIEHRGGLRSDWIVTEEKMDRTNDGVFMHCLPVRRNVVVSDAVLDSPQSIVIDEAENRLHVQKSILAEFLR